MANNVYCKTKQNIITHEIGNLTFLSKIWHLTDEEKIIAKWNWVEWAERSYDESFRKRKWKEK